MNSIKKTMKIYGFLWEKNKNTYPVNQWHFHYFQEVIDEPIVRGNKGIEIGSGCGYDTYIMAKNNPTVSIISIDISDGVHQTERMTKELKNVKVLKCSVLDIPFKNEVYDFAYSYGVLHHLFEPKRGLLEIARVLKKNSPVFLYLYENHSENILKFVSLKAVNILRKISIRIPKRSLYFLCSILSPFVFSLFSFPSRILKRFEKTKKFAEKIPFNFAKSPFSLSGDLYDRFGAPIEHRFSRKEVCNLLEECFFNRIAVRRMKDRAGWVVWGYKKAC